MLNNGQQKHQQKQQKHEQQQTWIEKCRKELIDIEEKNLRTRALYWTQIVNQQTKEFNNLLSINITQAFPQFEYGIDNAAYHLSFLYSWKGLRSEKLMAMPSKYEEFVFKSKNWVCGRRAPNYANTLFPEMIINAEKYARNLSQHLFHNYGDISQVYNYGLMYGYLSALCSSKITLNDRSKKTWLMFENSIKKEKNPTNKLLSRYVNKSELPNGKTYLSDLQSATAYFKVKYQHYAMKLRVPILQLAQLKNKNDINNDINQNQNKQNNQKVHNNQNMQNMLTIRTETDLYNLISGLMAFTQQQQTGIAFLKNKVNELEDRLRNEYNVCDMLICDM